MARLQRFFAINPAATIGASAISYVPLVITSRALSFLRMLLVAKILGDAGQKEFGIYQPALELINWIVPLVMFGLGDVAERYAAKFEKDHQLRPMLRRHLARLSLVGGGVLLAMILAAPWIAQFVWGGAKGWNYEIALVALCAFNILILAFYQYLAALLRGLRAYAASAAMESLSAILLLALSILAAFGAQAIFLLLAYIFSLLLPLMLYLLILLAHFRNLPVAANPVPHPAPPSAPPTLNYATPVITSPPLSSFARWTLLRLLLVMTFGFLTIWSIRRLSRPTSDPAPFFNYADYALERTAQFSMPYRIAQLLAYVATTLWASTYGLAAKAWSHHQTRRAKVQLFRIGKFGAVILTLLALALLLSRSLLAALLPSAYTASINLLLPPLLALFIWYGLLAFASTYCDLQEKPRLGALLWASAILIQLTLIFLPLSLEPPQQVLLAAAAGIGFALLILAPLILWHPFQFSATAVPLALLALAPLSLFSPPWIVDTLAPITMLGALALLLVTRLLIRPLDRRAWRRLRNHSTRAVPQSVPRA